MYLNKKRILRLAKQQGLSQNRLAREIGISRGAFSNALSGRRGAGRMTILGLLRFFPKETVLTLTNRKAM